MSFKLASPLLLLVVVACTAPAPDASVWEAFAQAKLLYSQGHVDQAATALSALVKRSGNFAPARLLYARALYFQREYASAKDVLTALQAEHPESLEASLWLVRTLLQLGQPNEAQVLVERLLAVNPDDPRLAYHMALMRENRNDLVGAQEFLISAEQADEDMALIYYERARVANQLHDTATLKRELTKALAVLPEGSLLRKPLETLNANLASTTGARP